jgi:hypothetical protein
MIRFRLAPIVWILMIGLVAALGYFVILPMLTGKSPIDNTPAGVVTGVVMQKTGTGQGGTVLMVDEQDQGTRTLRILDNQQFNSIQAFKRYSFTEKSGTVLSFKEIINGA